MSKVKFKIGISYFVMILFCAFFGQFLLLINYTFALILHEMAHYFEARKRGYKVNYIKLDMLGMKLNISENIDKNDHFWIALAGPVINFALSIICCALWWIVPETYYIFSNFFNANLMLALFNMLPIEPLDGGIILRCLLTNLKKKTAERISKICNIIIIIIFIALFIISLRNEPNFIFIVFVLFFSINLFTKKKRDNIDLFYKMLFKKNKPIEKVNLYKVSGETTLLECFKFLKQNIYSVFYYQNEKSYYITEMELQLLITKYSLSTTIKEICK